MDEPENNRSGQGRAMLKDGLAFLRRKVPDPVEHGRYENLREDLGLLRPFLVDGSILDFGASYGLSQLAALEAGARRVVGVEPDKARVETGNQILREAGVIDVAPVLYVPDTRSLPFRSGAFDTVLANAVFEHIPQPRTDYFEEVWRVLKCEGHLIIRETPNKYLPKDRHTTGLWWVPWLPKRLAFRYSRWRGAYLGEFAGQGPGGEDWLSSGWRGVGYWEVVSALNGHERIDLIENRRHKLLTWLKLPAQLLDPYPTWVFKKGCLQR